SADFICPADFWTDSPARFTPASTGASGGVEAGCVAEGGDGGCASAGAVLGVTGVGACEPPGGGLAGFSPFCGGLGGLCAPGLGDLGAEDDPGEDEPALGDAFPGDGV